MVKGVYCPQGVYLWKSQGSLLTEGSRRLGYSKYKSVSEEETKCLIVVLGIGRKLPGRVKKAGVFQVQICEEETKCLIVELAVNSLEVSRRTSQPRRNKMFDCCIDSKLRGKEFTTKSSRVRVFQDQLYLLVTAS